MSNFKGPRGRRNIPDALLKFGKNLVYSEGTKTEPYYVENIKGLIAKKYLCQPNDIDIIAVNKNGKSTNTIYLVNDAIADVDQRLANGEKIDNVWIFFDKDSFPRKDFDSANEKIEKLNDSINLNSQDFKYDTKRAIAWHSCWTNEAFELWLCLYFVFDQAQHNRHQYIKQLEANPKLKNINFKYNKNLENIHDILTSVGGSIDNAIKFSKKLNEQNGTGNPSSGVCEFAEFFLPYMEK